MAKFSLLVALLSVSLASATYIPRAAPGTQFITGPCSVDADCASGCCGFNSGKCAGAIIALTRDGGCGHGETSNSRAAAVLRGNCPGTNARDLDSLIESRSPLSPDPAGAQNVGNGQGKQFITGQCNSNADCASACCATLGNIGICSGPGAATQQGKTGCGFGGGGAAAPPAPPAQNNGGAAPPPPPPAGGSGLKPDPNGAPHVGNGKGEQFITGQCLSNADCASACCATLGSIGICSGPGAATQQGKTGCGFSSAGGAAPPPPPPTQNNGASAPPPPPPAAPASGAATAGKTAIGAACSSDADCTTACCGFTSGKCALAKTAPGSDGGCGKGEAAPNTRAANVINGNAPVC